MLLRTAALCGFLGLVLSGCTTAPNYLVSERMVKLNATPKPIAKQAAKPAVKPLANFNETDQTFVTNVFRGNLLEARLGEVAQKKATNKQVKDFGARMIRDHNQAQADLRKAAMKAGISLPKDLSPQDIAEFNKINSLTATGFDIGYMQQMQTDHAATVQLFQTEISKGQNADVKSFATKALPVIQEHLRLAEGILGTVKRYRIP